MAMTLRTFDLRQLSITFVLIRMLSMKTLLLFARFPINP